MSQPRHLGEDLLLGEVFRADWDNAHQGKAILVAGFHETLNEFISYHFSNTDLINQKNMLAKAKKPFKYTVEVLCSRLRHLNKLMSKLPGANNMLPYDEGALKIKLFKMMLSDWQINFNNAGLNITDDAYTLQRLVSFMTVQEAMFNAIQEHKRSTTTTLPACCSPARPGGGHVTFQQGRHGGRGLPAVHAPGAVPAVVQGAIAPSIQAYTTGRCVSPIHMGRIIGQLSVQACQGEQPGEDAETTWMAGDSRIAIKMSISQRIL
jgi:hypothetical protein